MTLELYPCLKKPLSKEKLLFAELLLEELELELDSPLTKLPPELLLEELEPDPGSPLTKLPPELLLEKLEPESCEVSLANNADSNSLAEFNVVALELVDDDALTPSE